MQPPQSEAMQIQQDDTLRQCMKLLASFHKSVKHAEEEIKQVHKTLTWHQVVS